LTQLDHSVELLHLYCLWTPFFS